MGQLKCPVCKRFGSVKNEGYCRTCYPKRYDDDDEKNPFADFCDDHIDGEFFPGSFGVLKKKFGYEER